MPYFKNFEPNEMHTYFVWYIYPVMYTTNHAISAMFNGEEFDCNKQH